MIEFLYFFVEQFFNVVNILDNIVIVGDLSLLNVLVISLLFYIAIEFIMHGGRKNE